MSISNKDYLNELIAKAKKSWEGVDVEGYMKNLRDDSIDKEKMDTTGRGNPHSPVRRAKGLSERHCKDAW